MGNYLFTFVLVAQVLLGIALVGFVLMQHGKGADMGAAFGSGASGSLFGASGSANVLSTVTAWLAAGFFATSLALAYLAGSGGNGASSLKGSVIEDVKPVQSVPAKEGAAPAVPPAGNGGAESIPK